MHLWQTVLAASLIPHTEIQAGGRDLPAGIQPPDGLMGRIWTRRHTAALLLFPAVTHQGPGALGARGHRLLRVRDHVHTRHLALLGGLVRTCQRGSDVVRVHHVFGMTAKGLEDFVVPYIWDVGRDTLPVSLW